MKKLLFIFVLLSALCLTGCTEYVKEIKEEKKSWGTEYNFYQISPEGDFTFYTLMIPDLLDAPSLYKKSAPKGDLNNMKVETFKNATVNSIVRQSGNILSITVNNQKYELLK